MSYHHFIYLLVIFFIYFLLYIFIGRYIQLTCSCTCTCSSFLNYWEFFIGEAHFNAYQKPLLYFQVLFLTGQFEAVSKHHASNLTFIVL